MSTQAKGSAFERLVAADLEARGWLTTRASNSKGIADVWAVCALEVALIECKAGRAAPDVQQWNQLFDAAIKHGAVPVVAMRRNGRLGDQPRIRYMRMLARKEPGQGVAPPWEPWDADEAATTPGRTP